MILSGQRLAFQPTLFTFQLPWVLLYVQIAHGTFNFYHLSPKYSTLKSYLPQEQKSLSQWISSIQHYPNLNQGCRILVTVIPTKPQCSTYEWQKFVCGRLDVFLQSFINTQHPLEFPSLEAFIIQIMGCLLRTSLFSNFIRSKLFCLLPHWILLNISLDYFGWKKAWPTEKRPFLTLS